MASELEPKRTASQIGRSNVQRAKAHERRVAHMLSEWTGTEFRRRRVEGREENVIDLESVGDVICPSRSPWFSIEAKCGKCQSFDALLSSTTADLVKWWHQANYDATLLTASRKSMRYPMLFFKPTITSNWVMVPTLAFGPILEPRLRPNCTTWWFPHLTFDFSKLGPVAHDVSHSKKHPVVKEVSLFDAVICRWEDFAEWIKPLTFFVPDNPNGLLRLPEAPGGSLPV